MDVWLFSLDTPRIRGSIVFPFYHFPSHVPHSTALDFDLQLRKQLALAAFFFFSEVLDLWPFLTCSPSHHYWCAFIGSRAMCLFSLLLLGMKDGGYLGLPLSGALRVRAEEKLPSAHNVPASIPVSQDIPSRWPRNSATAFQNTAFKSVSCLGRFRLKITKERSRCSNHGLWHQSSISNRQTVFTLSGL